jgi:hypothetical protein
MGCIVIRAVKRIEIVRRLFSKDIFQGLFRQARLDLAQCFILFRIYNKNYRIFAGRYP